MTGTQGIANWQLAFSPPEGITSHCTVYSWGCNTFLNKSSCPPFIVNCPCPVRDVLGPLEAPPPPRCRQFRFRMKMSIWHWGPAFRPFAVMWKVSHLPLEKTDVGAQSRIYLFALRPYCIVHICDKKQANRPSSFAVHCQFKWVRGVPNLPRATGWQKKAQRLDHIDYRRCIVTSRIYCALMLPHLRFALSDCKFARRQL